MKALWRKLTQHSGDPTENIPWYAPPLMAVFIVGAYALVQTLGATGF
ncbi:hypothetical protein PT7_P012 (plasmid) [Pusillimonas sp. T7-7]|nr:hypothetical protein [Pusillimonas sp. T7-7]AEC22248.1 hypothetical protein PT7_P012 [Pusillimonas sp. T7-7]